MTKDEQIERIMNGLKCSKEEAEQVAEFDRKIDKGERTEFDLTKEQEKIAKKFANVTEHKKPTAYKFEKRTRKENATKAGIIAEIATFLTENSENACENVEITNKERMIAFSIGENNYEITLIQKRKPKNS